MVIIYCTPWVIPVSSSSIEEGAVAVDAERIVGVGARTEIVERYPDATTAYFDHAVILPGLVNAHTHLELTAMRGFLEKEEGDFFAWLKKLTVARLERMNADDLHVSAAWGACEAARAGITCVGDASDSGLTTMRAVREVGLRGVVFQESFGPDPRLAKENLEKLQTKVLELREVETPLVRVGVSPHAPYTVSAPQLELIAEFATREKLPLMMHAAESAAEDQLLRKGLGLFAEGLAKRGIEWRAPGTSTIQYLNRLGVLKTRPLLTHCIRVDEADIETMAEMNSRIAHCPKSNAKLGHGHAPLSRFIEKGIAVGLGSDSVASNNTCDILEETRFAALFSRAARAENRRDSEHGMIDSREALTLATLGGARSLGLESQVGELREGLQADFTVLSLKGTHQLPCYDPIDTVVFSSSGRDVILTVVAGKEVFREGQVINVDEDRLRARMGEIAEKLNLVL
jgi:cytosine/adenosine deaminase-related metal-dependent hydrolase